MAVYLICYGISFILAWQHLYVLSGLVLVGAAVWLYIRDYIRTGNLIHLRGLFCLFFVGGQGISCFKLSYLQTDWLLITWISFFLAVMAFWWVFEVLTRLYDGWKRLISAMTGAVLYFPWLMPSAQPVVITSLSTLWLKIWSLTEKI